MASLESIFNGNKKGSLESTFSSRLPSFIKSPFTATPNLSVNNSTPAIETGPGTVDFVRELAQAIPRDAATVGVSIGNAFNKNTVGQTIDPKKMGPLGTILLGKEPIGGLSTTAAGYEEKLGGPGKFATPLAVLGTVAPISLDFLGVGGEAGALKRVVRIGNEGEAISFLNKIGVEDDLARQFANDIVLAKNEAQAKALLDDITKLQSTTRKAVLPEQAGKTALSQAEKAPLESRYLSQVPETTPKSSSYSDVVNPSINTERLLVSPEAKSLITQTVEEIKPELERTLGKRLSNKEAVAMAEATGRTLDRVVGREETLQWQSEMLKARQALAAASEKGTVDREFIESLMTVKSQGADIARKLQSLAIDAEAKDPTGKRAILEAVLKVNDNVDEVLKAAEGVNFSDLRQATEFYRQFVKPKASEWIDLLRYNSMLSSPKTHIVNAFSNFLNTSFLAPLEKVVTGGLDFIGSKFTGRERKYFAGEGAAYLFHYLSNAKKAFGNFADVIAGKRLYTNLDTKNIPVATGGVKGAIVSTLAYPSRLLEAMDQFFMTLGEGGELGALRYRGKKGAVVKDIEENAKKAAEYRLYREKPLAEQQGYLLDAVDQVTVMIQHLRNSSNPVVAIPAKFTVPFIQTPMNILKQGIEYSPVGFSTLVGAKNKTEQLSKAIIGSSIFAGASSLLVSNRITWGEPIDAAGKRDFRAAKQQPYSIKIGDTWYSYQKMPAAIAYPFAMVAALNDAVTKKKIDEGTADVILSSIAKFGSFLADQTYAKSIGDILSAVQGGEAGLANIISNDLQQLIPFRALGGWLTRLVDHTQRKVDTDAGFIEKQMQLLMMNIPGLSDNVPARTDKQGNPIEQPNPVRNAFSPIQTTTQTEEENKNYENLINYKQQKRDESDARAKELDRVQPIYDQAQSMKLNGDEVGAQALVDSLSETDYELYKSIKSTEHGANTTQLRIYLNTSPRDAVTFVRHQTKDEQARLLKVMTDEEYQMYEQGKKDLESPRPEEAPGQFAADVREFLITGKVSDKSERKSKEVDDRTLLEKITGTSLYERAKELAKNDYPFTEQAQKLIKEVPIEQGVPAAEGAAGTHIDEEKKKGILGIFQNIGSAVLSKIAPDLAAKIRGEKITIKDASDTLTSAHEILHSAWQRAGIDPAAFNASWEEAKKNDKDTGFGEGSFDFVDKTLDTNKLYAGISEEAKANERFAYLGSLMGGGGLESIPPEMRTYYQAVFEPGVAKKTYAIRDNKVTDTDLDEAAAILFGEISNRSPEKQRLEAQTILNTAFNRMEEYRKRGMEKTLTEVLQMPNQYQAYQGKQYTKYKEGALEKIDEQKLSAITDILEQVRKGTLKNNIGNYTFYSHKPDGRIVAVGKSLFAP